ncbi:MAG: 2'-5' RNA ligase [Herpetosiphonaceae bacterium]|nr:MAG: 2'-5' RNA ligase [Herpetosiphonaceae bacterium]
MPYAIELFLDPQAAGEVRRLWDALAQSGVSSRMLERPYRPHISLAVCDDLDLAAAEQELVAFARRMAVFPVSLSSLACFLTDPTVLFLGVTTTSELLDMHRDFHRSFAAYAHMPWSYYVPDQWVPHCTLAFGLEPTLLPKAVEVCRQQPLPIRARLEQIAIVNVPSGQERLVVNLQER